LNCRHVEAFAFQKSWIQFFFFLLWNYQKYPFSFVQYKEKSWHHINLVWLSPRQKNESTLAKGAQMTFSQRTPQWCVERFFVF